MQNSSVVSLLRERTGLQPDDSAFRYTDYEQDWTGITETLSWAQLLSKAHGRNAADLVLVSPGSMPTTTSSKIRRASCAEQYRTQQLTRLDT